MRKAKKQVEEYLNYCEKIRRMSPTTMAMKEDTLRRFIDNSEIKDLRKLTNEVFERWMEGELGRGISARSMNTYNSVIFAMVRYFKEKGLAIPLKISSIKRIKGEKTRRKFYTREEIEKVIIFSDLETELMIRIMFETGMRIAELTRLKVSDFEGRKVRFIGKGRKSREVYVSKETFRLLEEFICRHCVSGYLWGFRSLNGEPPTINTVRARLKKVFLEAGFSGFYPHALRHSFATDLQLKGASISEIKEMIGHESVATTERYLHGFEGRLEELFEKYR
ncbi:tyrosine-type recombinase/integrase [Candidatus Saccharibacteria bacterium]|nr:tyrosine-type recombinase/integrase [Candidatus Saccharibacteria bacterium]